MTISAIKTAEAYSHVHKAWHLMLKECQSRKWDTREEVSDIEGIIRALEEAELLFNRFQCKTFGFEFWKAEDRERENKQLVNALCKTLQLSLAFPDAEE